MLSTKPVVHPRRLMIVDDHEAVRAGLSAVLNMQHAVVGTYPSGEEAIDSLRRLAPDVALVDYRLRGRDGAWTCARLKESRPDIKVLILTSFADENILLSCLRAGANGFLTKTSDTAKIAQAVEQILADELVIDREVVPILMRILRLSKQEGCEDDFSPIDLQVLKYLSLGHSNKGIASALKVSEDTVKVRIRAIKRRLGASGRAHAVALAARRGLV